MFYDEHPVYHDPGSNQWFGMQVWSLQRVAELYYETGNAKAKAILDKWVPWAIANTTIGTGATFSDPVRHGVERRAGHLEPVQPGRQHQPARHRDHQGHATSVSPPPTPVR